jgi:hypothetical protein
MKRTALLLLVLTAGVAPAGPPIALKVTAAETVMFVRKFPARVTAPAGADLYEWTYPPGVKVVDRETNVLVITDAPDGAFTVACTSFGVKAGKLVRSRGTVEVFVEVAATPDPPPAPTPAAPKDDRPRLPPPAPAVGKPITLPAAPAPSPRSAAELAHRP